MRGIAFQVDRLASIVEDHQLLHELSLKDQATVEELPSELDLSEASTISLMSGVGPLPPDSISPDPSVESSVVQLPPDKLVCGEVDVAPVPTASSTPVRPSAPSQSSASRVRSRSNSSHRGSILRVYFPDDVSDSSCSESSMEEEGPLGQEGSEKPVVVEPDSQTVESVAPPSSPASSPVDFTAAAALSSPGSIIHPQPVRSSDVEDPIQTPQCIPPSSPREVASSDVLSTAGRSEDPASAIHESVMTGSPSSSSPLTAPGALSASLRSNPAPEGGEVDPSEAVDAEHPASFEQDSQTKDLPANRSPTPKSTDIGTHPLSPVIVVIPPAAVLSAAGSAAVPGSPRQDSSPSHSAHASPTRPSGVPSRPSSAPPSSSGRPVEQPAGTEKLALAGPLSPGSGQLSADASKRSASMELPESPPPASLDGVLPSDQAELLQDSFVLLQMEAGPNSEAQDGEDSADESLLDVTLEDGSQIPMDHPVIQRLHDEAARQVSIWTHCLTWMTLNEHPRCEFPHVYRIQNHAEYYCKMEIPARKPLFDEFEDTVLRNNLTKEYIHQADPFTVRYALARLLRKDISLPEEWLPKMEACLKWHRAQIVDKRDCKLQSIQELDSRLEKLSKPEAVQDVEEGNIVSPRRPSDSSFQSEELERSVDSTLITEEVKPEEPVQVKTEDQPEEPVKLEDQLLLPFADCSPPDSF